MNNSTKKLLFKEKQPKEKKITLKDIFVNKTKKKMSNNNKNYNNKNKKRRY